MEILVHLVHDQLRVSLNLILNVNSVAFLVFPLAFPVTYKGWTKNREQFHDLYIVKICVYSMVLSSIIRKFKNFC